MIFYESFYEAAQYLQKRDRDEFISAVLEYGCTGNTPNINGVPMAMFMMAKPLIDANKARKSNGSKGGRPKKEKSVGKFDNYEQSDTNWNEVADRIMEAQERQN